MANETTITQAKLTPSIVAAHVSFVAAAAFVVLLAALHIVKPELDPAWRFLSEYAIGEYGGLMVLAFLSLAVSFVALFVALRTQVRTIVGRIGLALLLISAAGLIFAGVFTTDPITTSHDAVTTRGKLHIVGGTLGMAMPVAAVFVSWALVRNPAWSSARRSILVAAGLAVVGALVSVAAVMVMLPSDGAFGPDVLVGWPESVRNTRR